MNGVKLHYFQWGSENASPLVLLHPAPLNAHVWDSFGSSMAARYRVIAPDTRGFGESQWSDSYSDDVFIQDLRGLMAVLGLKRVILCGNSMGGTLAYTYASLYPDDVDRLILVDTGLARNRRGWITGRDNGFPAGWATADASRTFS